MEQSYEQFKEQVRAQADIIKIVSEYVALKKKGGRYWGCCPFHGEKTPSFSVDEQKGLFHCFGCGVGGDVFSFIQKQEGKSFPEAVKFLAGKLGIALPEREKTPAEIAKEKADKEVFEANELAARFFHSYLLHTEDGKKALLYLQARGINSSIIDIFSIGLAPADYHRLHMALQKRGVTQTALVRAGLSTRTDGEGIYDRFRDRVMIPIKNPRGKVVGFGGRVLGAGEPKYLNTAETELFSKRNLLFGLDAALKAIKEHKQVVVVEGYMDAISLHAAGIDWAVASLGTAFSRQQAKLIKRIAPEVVFSFDNDRAGIEAAIRAVSIATEVELPCRVLVVTEGKDPDEFVRKQGKEGFEKLLREAVDGVDFQISRQFVDTDISTLAGKVRVVAGILPYLLECKNDIAVGQRIRDLARKLTIDEGLIQNEYNKARRKNHKTEIVPVVPVQNPGTFLPGQQAERYLLFALLKLVREERNNVLTQIGSGKIFTVSERQEIYQNLIELSNKGYEKLEQKLFEVLSEAAASEFTVILQLPSQEKVAMQTIQDCLLRLRLRDLEKQLAEHSALAAVYEKAEDEKFLQELSECQRISNEINKISAQKHGREGTRW